MFRIHNRRYLGSKQKLLSFISTAVSNHCNNSSSFLDLFGGTGSVAYHFNKDFDIKINDILQSNIFAYHTFFSAQEVDQSKIEKIIQEYNNLVLTDLDDNYYSSNFADTFLSKANLKKVGYIREDIEAKYKAKQINYREQAILITSLLYAIDRIANTVGHYDAFRRNGELNKTLVLDIPELNDEYNHNNQIKQQSANELVRQIQADIVYIDPPYNSRQYGDAYHFLENVACNLKPEVVGVARKMDRSHLKSDYCTNKASHAFKDLISNIDAKYILVSYNNTGNKINSRSNAKISDKEIIAILEAKGKVYVYEQDFNAFTTGKTSVDEHKERLFVCEVNNQNSCTQHLNQEDFKANYNTNSRPVYKSDDKSLFQNLSEDKLYTPISTHNSEDATSAYTNIDLLALINPEPEIPTEFKSKKVTISTKLSSDQEIVKSPLNYTGGKAKLMPQIRERLPAEIENFYDVFCGGLNVAINVQANKITCIDNNQELVKLIQFLQNSDYLNLLNAIEEKLAYYNLSNSFLHGYEYYGCNSSNGLGSYNKEGFLKLRADYNQSKNSLLFLLLIIFSFNNQIRFNRNQEFNLPVGKRDFNQSLRKKLSAFIDRLQNLNLEIKCLDFRQLDPRQLAQEQAFLYLDPPYLLATASYNENGGWTPEDELDLLAFLKACDEQGVKFALSNVLQHKGETHHHLVNWCLENSFNINHLDFNYKNSNYQLKDRSGDSQEVLITNY